MSPIAWRICVSRRSFAAMRRSLAGALCGLAALTTAPAGADPRVAYTTSMSAPSPVSGCGEPASEAFPQVAADPRHPRRLRAVYQSGGLRLPVGATSDDAGRTWSRSPLLGATACAGGPAERLLSVNPRVSVGPDGSLWYAQSWIGGLPPDTWRFGVSAQRMTGGRWAATAAGPSDDDAQNGAVLPDRRDPQRAQMLWTDLDQVDNPAAQYVPTGSRLMLAETRDGGKSWPAPRNLLSPPDPRTLIVNSRLERASDGSLLAFFDTGDLTDLPAAQAGLAPTTFTLHAMRSTDGGATWSAPQRVGAPTLVFVDDPDHGPLEPATPAASSKYDVATGPRGLAAAVWREPAQADGTSAVRLALSADGGRTWSAPRDTVHVRGEAIQPAVAIDGDGRIGILWYDFARDTPGDAAGWQTDAVAAVSEDRGRTWSTTRLTPEPFDLHATNACTSATGLGDPLTQTCALDYDATGVGAFPDLVAIGRHGFGAAYTVGPPLARDGFTDARFSRVRTTAPAGGRG
jgi:hypothetical protein